jgi:hypothetical protein
MQSRIAVTAVPTIGNIIMNKITSLEDAAQFVASKRGLSLTEARALLAHAMPEPIAPDTDPGPSLSAAARQLADRTGLSLADAQAAVYASAKRAAKSSRDDNDDDDSIAKMTVAQLAHGIRAANPNMSLADAQAMATQIAAHIRGNRENAALAPKGHAQPTSWIA